MDKMSEAEVERRKKGIFEAMGKRSQNRILKKGYENWNPFEEPKDPIDIRKDKTQRSSQTLMQLFLRSRSDKAPSNQYTRGVAEICLGLINEEDRFLGMFDFACWYQGLLEKEGLALTREVQNPPVQRDAGPTEDAGS